jgi:hypothetical protein
MQLFQGEFLMSPAIVSPPVPDIKPTLSAIDWHMAVVNLENGQVAAWITEWPDCRVEAESREAAIEAVQVLLTDRLSTIEVIPFPAPISAKPASSQTDNPWEPLYGLLKDDADFAAWADEFWAEKQRSHDDDEILSVEECLRVM